MFGQSDAVQITTAVIAFLGVLVTASVPVLILRMSNQQKETAKKAEEKAETVKQVLEENTAATSGKLDGLSKVAAATHVLVNNNMAIQLKLNAAVTRRLADLTKTAEDVAAADAADTALREHMAKQAVVDSREGRED